MTEIKPTRRIDWVSAKHGDPAKLEDLRRRMADYYENSDTYYEELALAAEAWSNPAQAAYREILALAGQSGAVLEVGCGAAGILKAAPELAERYAGTVFAGKLLENNRLSHPAARFEALEDSRELPFNDAGFDLVFSVFVLEHMVYPHLSLAEQVRVLKPGGTLAVLCPSILDAGKVASQRAGYSQGGSREKWSWGARKNALATAFDSKVRIPWACRQRRNQARREPRFWVNLRPTCFADASFRPDSDAVYLTCEAEIRQELADRIDWREPGAEASAQAKREGLLFLLGTKKGEPPAGGE